ncbi:MAG: hypothetical protein IJK64_07450 [Clostridia bacterium]|nr:hypothetical protein [Clostridia bacterium]
MYQSPDLVKVNLDVKDNFAAYASCPSDVVWSGGHVEGTCQNDGSYVSMLTLPASSIHQCYSTKNAPV